MKPANILVDAYGTPKLADFGLAAVLDAAGESSVTREALTPAYASPEAFAMAPPSPRDDVYALGATLYMLLAGRPPRAASWRYRSLDELMEVLRAPVAPIPGVHPELHDVLVEALRTEPRDRLPSAAALRDALQSVRAAAVDEPPARPERAAPPRPGSSATVPPPAPRSRRITLLAACAAVIALLIVAGVGILARGRSTPSTVAASAVQKADTAGPVPAGFADCEDVAAGALCPTLPMCWSGLVIVGGMQSTARPTACEEPHYWETYAAGRLPADAVGLPLEQVGARSEVARVCTEDIMRARLSEGADSGDWQRGLLPQQIQGQDDWLFHCVASPTAGGELTGAAFRSA